MPQQVAPAVKSKINIQDASSTEEKPIFFVGCRQSDRRETYDVVCGEIHGGLARNVRVIETGQSMSVTLSRLHGISEREVIQKVGKW